MHRHDVGSQTIISEQRISLQGEFVKNFTSSPRRPKEPFPRARALDQTTAVPTISPSRLFIASTPSDFKPLTSNISTRLKRCLRTGRKSAAPSRSVLLAIMTQGRSERLES